jgi:hypothetical protein
MGLAIYALRNPVFVKPFDVATDEDHDTLTCIRNEACFTGHLDGYPEGFYGGELSERHGSWPYSSYNRLRELICQAALGISPRQVWNAPSCFRPASEFEGIFALVNFSDCEGAIGPVTSAKIAEALGRLSLDAIKDAEDGRAKLLACFRDAADHNGFAVWA